MSSSSAEQHDPNSDTEVEVPPVPDELIILAHTLLAIGNEENVSCPHTLLKVEDLCEHVWNVWWTKDICH